MPGRGGRPRNTTTTTLPGGYASPEGQALAEQAAAEGRMIGPPAPVNEDPQVYIGRRTGGRVRRNLPDEDRPSTVSAGGGAYRGREQLIRDFYSWTPARLRKFQEQAYLAGLLGGSRENIAWGQADETTLAAWVTIIDRAITYQGTGRNLSPEQVLRQAARYGPPSLREGEGEQGGLAQNPIDIDSVVRQAAVQVLGRGLTDEETERFRTAWQALEAPALAPGFDGTAPPSVSAFAEQAIAEANPQEALGQDSRSVANAFFELLGGV